MKEITVKAVVARINRHLAHEGERLASPRSASDRLELGDYYAFNDRNCVTARHVDPEQWGRELGVVKPFEVVIR